jgi:hypothetical protein
MEVSQENSNVTPLRPRGRPPVPAYLRNIILQFADNRGVSVAAREWGVSPTAIYGWRAA